MKILILKSVLFLSVALFIGSCQKDNSTDGLEGSWIEISKRTDTIVFDNDVAEDMFKLKLGLELRDSYLLPKLGSGLYLYKLKKDSIALRNTLSSLSDFKNYSFKNTGDKIYIGDFYSQTGGQGVLTFEKMK